VITVQELLKIAQFAYKIVFCNLNAFVLLVFTMITCLHAANNAIIGVINAKME